MLTSFIIFFCCGSSTLAQLSQPSERCLSNVMRGREISDMRPLPQYRLGTITVVPADSDKSLSLMLQALRREFRLQPNEILNVGEIKHGLSRLKRIYCEFGFIDVTTEPEFKIDDAKRTIDVSILVHEGRQYIVNDLQFRGVDPKLEARLRSKLPRRSWLFNSAVLENFFKANRSVLPTDASPEDDVEFHRDTKDGTVALVFDFRPNQENSSSPRHKKIP